MDSVSDAAINAFLTYEWPGNIRELRNVIEHAFVVGEGPVMELSDLPPELRGEPPPGEEPPQLEHIERGRLVEAMTTHRGRKGAAASALGMSRSTLWRKLRHHRLSK